MKLFKFALDVEEDYKNWDNSVDNAFDDFEHAEKILSWNIEDMKETIREDCIQLVKSCGTYAKSFILAPFDGDVLRPEAAFAEIQFLKEKIYYARRALSFQKEIFASVTRDNYVEVARFSDYCRDYCLDVNFELDNRQDSVCHNIDCGFADRFDFSMVEDINSSFSNFEDFYSMQLRTIKSSQTVEKIKKS